MAFGFIYMVGNTVELVLSLATVLPTLTSRPDNVVIFEDYLDLTVPHTDSAILLREIRFGEDEDYTRLSDWNRLLNKLDQYDYKELINRIIGDWDGYSLYQYDNYTQMVLTFDEPVTAAFNNVRGEYLTAEITQLKGQLYWEYYYNRTDPHPVSIQTYLGQLHSLK